MQKDEAVAKVLDLMSQNNNIFLNMIKNLEKRIDMIEKERNTKPNPNYKISPVIFRYSRYLNKEVDEIEPRGGVTYAFQIDYEKRVASVGISVCSKDENFDKKLGCSIAATRLKLDPICFPYVTPSPMPLVRAFWRYVEVGNMSNHNMKILQKIDFRKLHI